MMGENVLIVESGNKVGSIQSYLGDDWLVFASGGHICDLPTTGELGIDKQTLSMTYVNSESGKKAIKRIRPHLASAKRVVLASDPDREGEAIAWHLKRELNTGNQYERAKFQEITQKGIQQALTNTTMIDENLVLAQTARRIIDRVVGWEATPELSDYVNDGDVYPVGRVQSQAVAIIARRQDEIEHFVSKEHYVIKVSFGLWSAILDVEKSQLGTTQDDGSVYWLDKEQANTIKDNIHTLIIEKIEEKQTQKYANVAFETATMHQAAANQLNIRAKQCDAIAQKLFEKGLITYIRTDSTVLSDDGYAMICQYATDNGLKLASKKRDGTKGAVAQEAHECIRPTNFDYDGSDLPKEEKQLYELIFKRVVASQLAPATYANKQVTLTTTVGNHKLVFIAKSSTLIDKGYLGFFDDSDDDKDMQEKNPIPTLTAQETIAPITKELVVNKTKPPLHFNEARLGKYLKEQGIGRPSTYSSIYEKIIAHGYVEISKEKGQNHFIATKKGEILVQAIGDIFSIMEEKFTMALEGRLDDIANGLVGYDTVVFEFFETLHKEVALLKAKPALSGAVLCEICQSRMKKRQLKSKKGYFWFCTNDNCDHKAFDNNGVPETLEQIQERIRIRAERQALYFNEDGGPKHPCIYCASATKRWESKKKPGSYFWVCSNKACNVFYDDDLQTKTPILQEKVKSQTKPDFIIEAEKLSTDKDGNYRWHCKKCKTHLLLFKKKNSDSGHYLKCQNKNCGKFYNTEDFNITIKVKKS